MDEGRTVDVLHQLRQSLGEEGQVHLVPDVVFGPLQQVQQRLQEGAQLCMDRERVKVEETMQGDTTGSRASWALGKKHSRHFLKRLRHLSSAILLQELVD